MKPIFSIACALLFFAGFSYAQGGKRPYLDPEEYLKEHREFNRFVKKQFILINASASCGTFLGSDSVNLRPSPRKITAYPFFLMKREVSVEEYLNFYRENKGTYQGINLTPSQGPSSVLPHYLPDKKSRNLPIVGVNKLQAQAYCRWLGHKITETYIDTTSFQLLSVLPTDGQFQVAAAKGFGEMRKPFTSGAHSQVLFTKSANYTVGPAGNQELASVNAYRAPDLGFFNLLGNVSEWILDIPRDLKVEKREGSKIVSTGEDAFLIPDNLKALGRENLGMIKGGSYKQSAFYLQPAVSSIVESDKGYLDVGFRPMLYILYRRTAG